MKGCERKKRKMRRNILYRDVLTIMLLWNIPRSYAVVQWNSDAKIKVCTNSGGVTAAVYE
jgi:hypothetical protein